MDFRIMNEETFTFKDGKIYLMLLKDNGKFGIELADRTKAFGRIMCADRKHAEYLFKIITKSILKKKTLAKAEELIHLSLKRKSLPETVFLFLANSQVFSQDKIGVIVFDYNIKVKAVYDVIGEEKKKGGLTINVYFKSKRKPFGRFIGTRFGKDFIFEKF
jgi:hypothetical protein